MSAPRFSAESEPGNLDVVHDEEASTFAIDEKLAESKVLDLEASAGSPTPKRHRESAMRESGGGIGSRKEAVGMIVRGLRGGGATVDQESVAPNSNDGLIEKYEMKFLQAKLDKFLLSLHAPAEKVVRQRRLLKMVRSIVHSLFGEEAELLPFGSAAAGLETVHSDVDLQLTLGPSWEKNRAVLLDNEKRRILRALSVR